MVPVSNGAPLPRYRASGCAPCPTEIQNLTSVSKELAITLGTLAHLTEENTERAFQRGEDFLQLKLIMPPARSLSVAHLAKGWTRWPHATHY